MTTNLTVAQAVAPAALEGEIARDKLGVVHQHISAAAEFGELGERGPLLARRVKLVVGHEDHRAVGLVDAVAEA